MEEQRVEIPVFNTKQETFKHLKENKAKIVAQKKAIVKRADGFAFVAMPDIAGYGVAKTALKAGATVGPDTTALRVKAIINTTGLLDSHGDVHIAGLWDKSLQENKMILHVKEHKSWEFESIISEGNDLKASATNYTWKELGFPEFKGSTQALEFDSVVKRSRNEFMFDQYAKGYVKNHSVGMRYVKIVLCINDDDEYYGAEKEAWDKYIDVVVNRQAAEDKGWMWIVKEAKVVEGSAVPLGSNHVTPTFSVEAVGDDTSKAQAAKALELRRKLFY